MESLGDIYKNIKLQKSKNSGDLREMKNDKEFVTKRVEILTMIWDMEEEIMGKEV